MATPDAGPLVGRERECAAIDRLLELSARGESCSLVLRGEAGIGKTALLEYAAEQAGGMTVLRAVGIEAESELAFAGLYALVRPIVDRCAELPEPQAAALAGALGLAPSAGGDRLLVSVATLGLLAAAADEHPLLCLIDDAQWLDIASADALVFSARRFAAEPVAIMFTVREGEARTFATSGLPELVLEGLPADAAAALLGAAAPEVADSVREWLLAQAEGNPLALLELPRGMSEAELRGRAALPDTTSLTFRLQAAFLQRIEQLPEGTRAALLMAAIDESGETATLVRAMAASGLPEEALDAAEEAGLVRIHGGGIAFRHPLVRSALHGSATLSRRRQAHAALAEALDDAEHADRRVWHEAMATLTTDEEVASALEASARRSQARAGHSSAATAFARAAELTVDESRRTERLTAAAKAAWAAGQPERARELIGRTLPLATGEVRGKLLHLQGIIEATTGDLRSGVALLLEAADATGDSRLKLDRLQEAAEAAVYVGDLTQAVAIWTKAASIEPRTETERFRVAAVCGLQAAVAGDHEHAAPLLEDALRRAESLEHPRLLMWAADCAAMAGTFGDGLPYATRAVTVARERALLSILPQALHKAATAQVGQGRFNLAYASAEEGIRLARDFGHHWGVSWNLTTLATLDALRGDERSARAHADEAVHLAGIGGATILVGFAEWSLGMLDLTAGRPSDAADALLALSGPDRPQAHTFIALMSTPDLIEAAARSGRLGETVDRFERYTNWVMQSPTPARLALLARCRALTGEGEEREQFDKALEPAVGLYPFEQARTELLCGEWLRRQRQPRDARVHLRKAADLFRRVGAPPWQERAEGELRATGETARRRDPSTLDQLTPQELQIAGLVAGGMTNRQIATQLYLSPRTIDYHLRKVFSKLGLSSRTELVRMGVPEHEPV